jgi:hypothetical protein
VERLGRGVDGVNDFMNKSQWQIRPKFVAMLIIAFGIPLLAAMILPMFSGSHKLRGNGRNFLLCRHQMDMWKREMTNDLVFDFSKLSFENKQETISVEKDFDGRFKTNFAWQSDHSKRQIIIVCGQEFDNVHKPGFWNSIFRNPAHAVGYSDGTVGLISPEEYTNFYFSGFVSASSLATNVEFLNHP